MSSDPEYLKFFVEHGEDKIDVHFCDIRSRISVEHLYQMFKQRYNDETPRLPQDQKGE